MFSKFAILVYCLPLIVYLLDSDLAEWLKIAMISCYLLGFLALFIIYALRVDIVVTSGQAPVERLHIAYKFSPPTERIQELTKEVKRISKQYPALKRIFFYYTTSDVVDLGCAGGIILSEEIASDAAQKKSLVKAGFQLLSTPPVSHAVFSEYPVTRWLPLTQWLACYRTYPRIHRYCEKHNLSAYPMIEIYNSRSVLFFAPLSRQDAFVVPEAEETIERAKIKLEELEEGVSGSEASNSEASDVESEASRVSVSTHSGSARSLSIRSPSLRSSIASTVSQSTVMSYYSTYDNFSDDEDAQKEVRTAGKEGQSLFRRSMSSCARTVKHMLGFSTSDNTSQSTSTPPPSAETSSSAVATPDTTLVDSSAEAPSTSRSKSANGVNGRGLNKSVSRMVSALNLLGAEAKDSPSCAAAIKLELKAESIGQCTTAVQNNFQVPTVSFVGA